MRRGFTLIELILVIFIIVVMILVCAGIFGGGCRIFDAKDPVTGTGYYDLQNTGVFQCVKSYETGGDSSSKRVDLKPAEGGNNVTMCCDDSWRAGVNNSASIYAQFENEKWYSVTYIGFRREGWNSRFPLVVSVAVAEDPTIQEMENPITEVPAEVNEDSFMP